MKDSKTRDLAFKTHHDFVMLEHALNAISCEPVFRADGLEYDLAGTMVRLWDELEPCHKRRLSGWLGTFRAFKKKGAGESELSFGVDQINAFYADVLASLKER